MYLIAGLGNPGRRYQYTRHNLGFLFLDYICIKLGEQVHFKAKRDALFYQTNVFGTDVILVKPTAYMNLSGNGVRDIMDYFKLAPDRLIVCHDDLDLPAGYIRIREKGSSGGHKGVQHILSVLGTDQFLRIRFGIDSPDRGEIPSVDYVLGKIPTKEQDLFESAFASAYDALKIILQEQDLEKVKQLYNKRS